jgi:hypothetical protein
MTDSRTRGARTAEELTTLLEDALIVGDLAEIERLFEADAALLLRDTGDEAHGAAAIARALIESERHDGSYVATPELVLRSRDLALTIGAGIHVLRHDPDRTWRHALSVLDLHEPAPREAGRP